MIARMATRKAGGERALDQRLRQRDDRHPVTTGDEPASTSADAVHLARMLQFGDSVFPIGGFAFSGGLQTHVVSDAASLLAFTRTAVEQANRGDGIGLVCAYRAAGAGDIDEVVRIDSMVYARKLSGETRTMSVRMGKKFTEMGAQVTGSASLVAWRDRVASGAPRADERKGENGSGERSREYGAPRAGSRHGGARYRTPRSVTNA